MARRPGAIVLALLVVSPASGCLTWLFGGDVDPVEEPPSAAIALNLTASGRTHILVTFPERVDGDLEWSIARGASVVAEGPLTRTGNETFLGTTAQVLTNGTYTVRVTLDGLRRGERAFTLAEPPWAPPGAGTWTWASERRENGNLSAELDGSVTWSGGTWAFAGAGALHDASGRDLFSGTVTELTEERRGRRLVASRLAYELDLRTGEGGDLGASRTVRTLLGEDLRRDFTGALVQTYLFEVWTHTTGTRPTDGGPQDVNTTRLVYQWVAQDTGRGVTWARWTWDNATGHRGSDTGFGDGATVPDLLRAWYGRMPQAGRAGDTFAFTSPGGGRLTFTLVAAADGLVGDAVVGGGATGTATLKLDRESRLLSYDENVTTGTSTTVVALRPAG